MENQVADEVPSSLQTTYFQLEWKIKITSLDILVNYQ